MTGFTERTILAIALVASCAAAVQFHEERLGTATYNFSLAPPGEAWPNEGTNECGHNLMAILEYCSDGPLLPHSMKRKATGCHYADGYPKVEDILNNWKAYGLEGRPYSGDFPPTYQQIVNDFGGRVPHFFVWRYRSGWHCGVFIPEMPGKYGSHNGDGSENRIHDFYTRTDDEDVVDVLVFRMPEKFADCHVPKNAMSLDSTMNFTQIMHGFKCCWKEKLGGSAPWTSRSTPYACLNWDETNGTTWDTMVSRRTNFASCTSVVFIQSCTTNLQRNSNTIEIRGSTNNGLTWPYLVGTDTTKKSYLPWAQNQRDVRLAWIYNGNVQEGRFWCVDDIGFWGKPAYEHDVSASEVWRPNGILTQGSRVLPVAFVWNGGKVEESIPVTFRIGDAYTCATWVRLAAYADTILTFPQWTASPGAYTATCYTDLVGDELRANDTVCVQFRVVGDTWVKMYPVYAGGGMWPGSCMAPTDSDNIYCVPGQRDFFAKYIVSQNL
jgi:hypothetical protein